MALCRWRGGAVDNAMAFAVRMGFMSREEISNSRGLVANSNSEDKLPAPAGELASADNSLGNSEEDSASSSQLAETEDEMLALLERRDLSPERLEGLGRNPSAIKSRKVCCALAAHPHAPRHLALRLIRHFYSFDLMQFALKPGAAADLKRFADDLLIARLDSITLGERLTLARRGSNAIAAALLLDKEARVFPPRSRTAASRK
jgi:hypothetical protein